MKWQALVVGINFYPQLGDAETVESNLTQAADDAEKIAQFLEIFGNFQVTRLPTGIMANGKCQFDKERIVYLEELE